MLFQHPERPAQNVGIVSGMLGHMRWQLTQPHVKPYRPAGLAVGEVLGNIVDLLNQDRRQEIVEQGLFDQAHAMLGNILVESVNIYPEE